MPAMRGGGGDRLVDPRSETPLMSSTVSFTPSTSATTKSGRCALTYALVPIPSHPRLALRLEQQAVRFNTQGH